MAVNDAHNQKHRDERRKYFDLEEKILKTVIITNNKQEKDGKKWADLIKNIIMRCEDRQTERKGRGVKK